MGDYKEATNMRTRIKRIRKCNTFPFSFMCTLLAQRSKIGERETGKDRETEIDIQ